ncbi:hypothetical protein [Microbacterium gorillae]|uniref:hypothetical protein n=1 Tax=Microbacterium gorillae TaxID=1231063 RepID=UPI00058FF887|nr:hypothetical protein [Microbacterium gorillae]
MTDESDAAAEPAAPRFPWQQPGAQGTFPWQQAESSPQRPLFPWQQEGDAASAVTPLFPWQTSGPAAAASESDDAAALPTSTTQQQAEHAALQARLAADAAVLQAQQTAQQAAQRLQTPGQWTPEQLAAQAQRMAPRQVRQAQRLAGDVQTRTRQVQAVRTAAAAGAKTAGTVGKRTSIGCAVFLIVLVAAIVALLAVVPNSGEGTSSVEDTDTVESEPATAYTPVAAPTSVTRDDPAAEMRSDAEIEADLAAFRAEQGITDGEILVEPRMPDHEQLVQRIQHYPDLLNRPDQVLPLTIAACEMGITAGDTLDSSDYSELFSGSDVVADALMTGSDEDDTVTVEAIDATILMGVGAVCPDSYELWERAMGY